MPLEDRMVYFCPPNLDGRFWRVGYSSAFNLSVNFFGMYHIVPSFFVNGVQFATFFPRGMLLRWTSLSRSSSLCWTILHSKLSMYASPQQGTLLFSRRDAGCTTFVGFVPTRDFRVISRMNIQWSPMPYLNGMTQELAISIARHW